MNNADALTIRIDDECYNQNGWVAATHAQREEAIAHARNIARSGYWFGVPVGFCIVFQGRQEVAAFHYQA